MIELHAVRHLVPLVERLAGLALPATLLHVPPLVAL